MVLFRNASLIFKGDSELKFYVLVYHLGSRLSEEKALQIKQQNMLFVHGVQSDTQKLFLIRRPYQQETICLCFPYKSLLKNESVFR